MKLSSKNKIIFKVLTICFVISLCLLYTVGGFLRDNIYYDPNEIKLGRQCMLFNLKRLDFLSPDAMQTYDFNKYSRFSKRNPDIRMELAYTDSDNVINYYVSKGLEKGWEMQSIEQNRLIMHRADTVRSKPVKVILQLHKMKENMWEMNVSYEYIG